MLSNILIRLISLRILFELKKIKKIWNIAGKKSKMNFSLVAIWLPGKMKILFARSNHRNPQNPKSKRRVAIWFVKENF